MRRVALTLMAHPDDAEILCGGTLIRLASLGWDVHIVTGSRGDCGTTTLSPEQIMSVRSREAAEAAARIGATFHTLDERDVLMVFDKSSVRKAIDMFRRIAPTLVFTHPRRDYMLDHEQISLLARAATFAYAIPNASTLPILPGSAVPHLYYCDSLDGVDDLGRPTEPTTWIDISEQLDAKADMLACHASQREWLRAHHGMDEYLESMRRYNRRRGSEKGLLAAEVFVQHRGHAYPQDDLLAKLFPLVGH